MCLIRKENNLELTTFTLSALDRRGTKMIIQIIGSCAGLTFVIAGFVVTIRDFLKENNEKDRIKRKIKFYINRTSIKDFSIVFPKPKMESVKDE